MTAARLRQHAIGGLIEDDPLAVGGTTLTSAGLAAMDVVTASTNYMAITLDPDALGGEPEIAYVTAHSAAATTATISRGEEGSTARSHNEDIRWVHGPTAADFASDWALIEEIELASTATEIEFSAIPNYWRDLVIVGQLRTDRSNATDSIGLRVGNGTVDSGGNYDYFNVTTGTNAANADAQSSASPPFAPLGVGDTATSGYRTLTQIQVLRYADIVDYRQIMASSTSPASGTVYNQTEAAILWKDTTDEIDVVRVFPFTGPNFVAGSYLTLYGRGERRNP